MKLSFESINAHFNDISLRSSKIVKLKENEPLEAVPADGFNSSKKIQAIAVKKNFGNTQSNDFDEILTKTKEEMF